MHMSFYTHYAKSVGFGISIRNSHRSKISREFIDVSYACTRYGKKRESSSQNPRPCLKVGCEASLRVKRICDGKWIVHSFIKDHNPKLFLAYAHYFPCHRGINKAQKHSIETLHHVGVRTSKFFATMAKEYGGYETLVAWRKM
uniref:FAR1 n=1 Tax=Medicago truncatula TaxID=3880 RepID=A2Q5B2_MEDTR|nr:FAR1 [Medicago truncatula]